MVNVDISNVWTCISLPELLGCEQEVFDAHNRLRDAEPDGPDHMGWLRLPEEAGKRMLRRVHEVAELIREDSQVLLVCGCGGTFHGTKAAVEAFCGARPVGGPEILFIGQSLCGRQWQELNRALEGRDYSLFIISADGTALAPNLTVRTLRWMMERKYADEAKSRIYVATLVGSPLHTMAQEEGYELFPLPKQCGGRESVLTTAALVPLAAAGADPFAVMEGILQSDEALDLRAFENPAWLYAAAKSLLVKKGRSRELLCLTDHDLQGIGGWLRHTSRMGSRELSVETVLLPGETEAADRLALYGGDVFETVLHFDPPTQRYPVEMDWKDYDALGFLAGKNVGYVQENLTRAMIGIHNDAGVPVFDVDAGALTGENLGALLHFFELSSALTSCLLGHDPFAAEEGATRQAALANMGAG